MMPVMVIVIDFMNNKTEYCIHELRVYILVIEPLNVWKNCLGNSQVGCYGWNVFSHCLWMNCKKDYRCASLFIFMETFVCMK